MKKLLLITCFLLAACGSNQEQEPQWKAVVLDEVKSSDTLGTLVQLTQDANGEYTLRTTKAILVLTCDTPEFSDKIGTGELTYVFHKDSSLEFIYGGGWLFNVRVRLIGYL